MLSFAAAALFCCGPGSVRRAMVYCPGCVQHGCNEPASQACCVWSHQAVVAPGMAQTVRHALHIVCCAMPGQSTLTLLVSALVLLVGCMQVGLPTIPAGWHQQEAAAAMAAGVPDVLGWEANAQGKLLPR